ncbi:hypothetical protein LeptoLang_15800 [Leptospira interrogans serovar Icterohaemorrhagiae]|nr:hypothetical protein LeptoLang_15800 [Leptospira interrogans serovar Icterohaemorrhagiae]
MRSRSKLKLKTKYRITFLSYSLSIGVESAVRRRRIRSDFFYIEFILLKYKLFELGILLCL